jgi:hypothetical protein
MIWRFKKQEDLIKKLTLNPSLGKRGIYKSPFSSQEKGFGDEFFYH